MEDQLLKLYPVVRQSLSWTYLLEQIDLPNRFDDKVRQRLKSAVEFLRQELGNGFFNNCGSDHPVESMLRNWFYLPERLLSFTETLGYFKNGTPAYVKLIGKIVSPKLCAVEGIPFMEIAGDYLSQGFDVAIPDITPGQKNPDMRVTDPSNGAIMNIEVSQLNHSDYNKRIHAEYNAIANELLLYGFDIPYAGNKFKELGPLKLENILSKVRSMRKEAVTNESFISYETDDILLGIAHPSCSAQLKEWCSKHGITDGFSGMDVYFNETPRITGSKLKKELEQLTSPHAGIVYLPVNIMYFLTMNRPEAAIAIMKRIYAYPNIAGVVLYSWLAQPMKEEFSAVNESVYSVKRINRWTRFLFFIENLNYDGILPVETYNKMKKCF